MKEDKNAFMEKLLKERKEEFDKKLSDYNTMIEEQRSVRLEVRTYKCVYFGIYEFLENS